jgi:type IV secretory pathway TraG/TraD family ATPase VirD4
VTAKHGFTAYLLAGWTRLALIWACLAAVVAGLLTAATVPALGLLVLVILACRAARRPLPVTGAFGVARFANVIDLLFAQMLYARSGILVGRVGGVARFPSPGERLRALFFWPGSRSIQACLLNSTDARKIRRAFVRVVDFVHGLVVAPPGRGKSRCIALPILLDYLGPVFVLDIKGELFRTAAGRRCLRSGRSVILIDPFGITGYASDTMNPLVFSLPRWCKSREKKGSLIGLNLRGCSSPRR